MAKMAPRLLSFSRQVFVLQSGIPSPVPGDPLDLPGQVFAVSMGYGIQVIEMKALYGFPSSHLYACSLLSSNDLRYHLVEVQINSATISCKPNDPIVFTNLLLFPACLFTFSATLFLQVLVGAVI